MVISTRSIVLQRARRDENTMREGEESQDGVTKAYNKRPSQKSVKEVLDIVQQQHSPRFASGQGGNLTNSKTRAPLPAIKTGVVLTHRHQDDGSPDENYGSEVSPTSAESSYFAMKCGQLASSTERFYISSQSDAHIQNEDVLKVAKKVDSFGAPLQREGTFQQLPPLTRLENHPTKTHPGRTVVRSDSRGQARPSTGYGRRTRAQVNQTGEANSHTSGTTESKDFAKDVHHTNKSISSLTDGRPRTGYGRRSRSTSEVTQQLGDGIVMIERGANKRIDVESNHCAAGASKSIAYQQAQDEPRITHKPLKASRSTEYNRRHLPSNSRQQSAASPAPSFVTSRPKSSKGRTRQPPPAPSDRSESGFSDYSGRPGSDIARPSAPTPPSPCAITSDDEAVFD